MLEQASQEFKRFFLIEFTKELINQQAGVEIFKLKEAIKKEQETKKTNAEKLIQDKKRHKTLSKELKTLERKTQTMPMRVLKIPAPRLPARLQYLRPIPTNIKIDLGRLNFLINNPLVKSIECGGSDQNIIVNGTKGTKKTNIILSKKEIDEIIMKFSQSSKIPIQEGVFKVAVGRLIFSAIVSKVISSKFMIQKMTNPGTMPMPPMRR